MKVIHKFKNFIVEGEGIDNFILTNKTGGYASFSNKSISKYQGVFFNEGFEKFKVIENIKIPGEMKSLINKFWCVERERELAKEAIFMPTGHDALVYALEREAEITLVLDSRKMYDFDEWGRNYKIQEKDGKIIVTYTKEKKGKKEYEIYLAILPDRLDYDKIGKWREVDYSYDSARKSKSKMYVYDALKLRAKQVVFGFSTSKEKAIQEAEFAKNNIEALKKEKLDELHTLKLGFMLDRQIKMAYLCAQDSLNNLICNINSEEGILAGLYWFDQFWSRDELVSLKALILEGKYKLVKQILFKYIRKIMTDGRLPNRIPEWGKSADSIGWLFKRVSDLIEILEEKGILMKTISRTEAMEFKSAVEKASLSIKKNYSSEDGLILNKEKETWMDSVARDGARIEIQAMQLNMYKLMKKLCKKLKDNAGYMLAEKSEKELLEVVRKNFWNKHYLNDGLNDKTIRPNVFIAYYIYPELLTQKQWMKCFSNILPRLWTGLGYSSLDMHHPNFQPYHTGEDDRSYHSGDSWHWINCLATICLFRLGKFRFYKHIQKPAMAAANDILWQGIPGSASEISSAKDHKAFGCFDQAWSNALFIEMIEELF